MSALEEEQEVSGYMATTQANRADLWQSLTAALVARHESDVNA